MAAGRRNVGPVRLEVVATIAPSNVTPDFVETLLVARRYAPSDVVAVGRGNSSSAFRFRSGRNDYVIRFGHREMDYRKDKLVREWCGTAVPMAKTVEIGPSDHRDCGVFSITHFIPGDVLHGLDADGLQACLPSLFDSLAAMRKIVVPGMGYGRWTGPAGSTPHASWADALLHVGARDDPRAVGWQMAIASHDEASAAFARGLATLTAASAAFGDERHLIHGDLTFGNILTVENHVSGLIDWGDSQVGDPLYDLGVLLFWASWRTALDQSRVEALAHERFPSPTLDLRLQLYQIHAGLEGLQYRSITGPIERLEAVAERVERLCDGVRLLDNP